MRVSRRSTPWLIALACIVGGGLAYFWRDQRAIAQPDPKAEEAVAKAWTIGRRVPLSGKQTVLIGNQNRSREVQAEVLQSGAGEVRIKYLTEPLAGVTIWESQDRTYRYNPKHDRLNVSVRSEGPNAAQEQEEHLLENYTARKTGEEEVANRNTWVIELRPKSGSKQWKRLWIDPNSWVTLASEVRRGEDQIVRRTRFTEVTYLPESQAPKPEEFRPSDEMVARLNKVLLSDTGARFDPAELSERIGFEVRPPKALPKGYRFVGAHATRCACGDGHLSARMEFSDGLNTITLFECEHPLCVSKDNCFASEGASSPLSVQLETPKGRYLAVGDAPKAELEKLVRSAAE